MFRVWRFGRHLLYPTSLKDYEATGRTLLHKYLVY